jgi:hypothetical protein
MGGNGMKTFKKISAVSAVIALGMSASVSFAETLRLGDFQSTSHIVSIEGTSRWMAAVEEATDGALKFQHFPSQQAAKSKAQLDAVNNGILDAALLGTLYHAESLPLNSVVGLPGFYSSAQQGTQALQTMLDEGPLRDEFLAAGVTPIFGFVLPPLPGVGQETARDARGLGGARHPHFGVYPGDDRAFDGCGGDLDPRAGGLYRRGTWPSGCGVFPARLGLGLQAQRGGQPHFDQWFLWRLQLRDGGAQQGVRWAVRGCPGQDA